METFQLVIWILIITSVCVKKSAAVSVEKDLTISSEEKRILEIFKRKVSPILKQDYQREDIYLLRWLRAKRFDLVQAEEMLLKDQNWRKENQMDTVLEEDWSEFERNYPYSVDGIDREGRPILVCYFTRWDIRGAILSGQRDKMIRYLSSLYERAVSKVREFQKEGKNVTQWTFFVNLDGFNVVQQGCIQCLPIYVALTLNSDNHYPGSVHQIVMVNTPQIFEIVLNLIRSALRPETRDLIIVHSINKGSWGPKVFSEISPDQLTVSAGGNKEDDL